MLINVCGDGRLKRLYFAAFLRLFLGRYTTMKTLNKVALLIATAAMATAAGAQTVDNWRSGDNQLVWKNGTNEHCWRDANWTPATAAPGCDGAIVPVVISQPDQAPAVAPPLVMPQPQVPAQATTPPPPVVTQISYAADTFFDFDKSVLRSGAKERLDLLLSEINGLSLEVVVAVGHTDSVGTDDYNQRLSERRAEAVKAYLISRGIEKNRVHVEGRGESQPVADNRNSAGRAENRRVEIDVVGTRRNN